MKNARLLPVLLVLLCFVPVASADVTTGTILGTVTDQSGAPMPGVQVVVKDQGTGFERPVTTGSDGDYVVENLKPGQYQVTADKSGFREKVLAGVTLLVAQRARIDIQMEVGQTTEKVEVTAAAPVVETDHADVGEVVGTQQVLELPLNGRNFIQLATLTPGVQSYEVGYMDYTGGAISANGMSAWANCPMIDGIYNQDEGAARMAFSPSIDEIQEFKIQTNSYDAEYGQSAGAQISIITKRGTGTYHGSAFEFVRNDNLDARPFFQPGVLPHFSRNQFGGTFGGPVPHSKKDFFFVSYEGLRSTQGLTAVLTVPTAALKQGNFAGTGTTVYDPTSLNTTTNTRTSFLAETGANAIPTAMISSQATNFYNAYWPNPQTSALSNNYVSSPIQTVSPNEILGRYDRDFSEKDTLTIRYDRKHTYEVQPFGSSGFSTPLAGFQENENFWGENHKVGWSHIFSPSMQNTLNLGFSQYHQDRANADAGINFFAKAGITGVPLANQTTGFPELIISGFTGLNDNYVSGVNGPENNYILNDTLNKVWGKHSVKIGGGVVALRAIEYFNAFTSGRITYSPTYTTSAPNAAGTNFNAFGDYLLGDPAASNIYDAQFQMDFREHWSNGFIQDNWNVSKSLTLTLGLRYEVYSPPVDARNRYRAIDLRTLNWVYPGAVPTGQPGVPANSVTAAAAGLPRAIEQPTLYNHWQPRIGFAYRLFGSDKTVLRGGYGLFYNWTVFDMPTGMGLGAAPWDPVSSIACNSNLPCVTSAAPFATTIVPTTGGQATDGRNRAPYAQLFSLGVQRELTPSLGLDVSYVGNFGIKNWTTWNWDQPFPGPGSNVSREPYPQFSSLGGITTWGNSNYNALQVNLRKRYSRGLTGTLSYTWSHTLGNSINGPEYEDYIAFRDTRNWKADYGPTEYDLRQILSLDWVYELPFGKGKTFASNATGAVNQLINGWKFGGIGSFHTGNFLTATDASNISNSGGTHPNITGNPNGFSHSSRGAAIQKWFNTAEFSNPAQYTFGSAGTGVIVGPGYADMDLSLYRQFAFAENKRVEIRAEFFNAFNRPNFGNPGTTFGTGSFGTIGSVLPGRDIQLGARFDF